MGLDGGMFTLEIVMSSSEGASGGGGRPGVPAMREIDAGGAPSVQELASAGSARPDHRPLLVILRVLGIRGFLTAVPAFHALAEAFPDHRRILVAPARLAPLVRDRSPRRPGTSGRPHGSRRRGGTARAGCRGGPRRVW